VKSQSSTLPLQWSDAKATRLATRGATARATAGATRLATRGQLQGQLQRQWGTGQSSLYKKHIDFL